MTRNPERIPEIMEALEEKWKEHPDQRLGQLVCNLYGYSDPFHLEDDILMETLGEELSVPLFVGDNPWEDM